MTTTGPQPDAASPPPEGARKPSRNVWMWVAAALALVAIGLLIWALRSQSDLDSAQADLKSTEQEVQSTQKELSATKQQLAGPAQPTPAATPPPPPEGSGGKEQTAARVAAGALVTG